jgi:hypothetical protein
MHKLDGRADTKIKTFADQHNLEILECFDASSPWPKKTRGQIFVSSEPQPRTACPGPLLVLGQVIEDTGLETCQRLLERGRFEEFEAALKLRGTELGLEHFEHLLLKVRMFALTGHDAKAAKLVTDLGELSLNPEQRIRWQVYVCTFDLIDRNVELARTQLAELRSRHDFFEQRPTLYAELMHAICVCADLGKRELRLTDAQEAESAFRQIGSLYGVLRAQQFQILALVSLGRSSDARSLYLSAQSTARENGFIAAYTPELATQLLTASLREGRLIDLDRLVDTIKPLSDVRAQSKAVYFLRVLKLPQLADALSDYLTLQKNEPDKADVRQVIAMLAEFKVGRAKILEESCQLGFFNRRDSNSRFLLIIGFLEFSFQSDFLTDLKVLEKVFEDLKAVEQSGFVDVRAPYNFFRAAFWASKKNYAKCLEILADCLKVFENGRQGYWAFRAALLEAQVSIALGNLRQAGIALQMARRWEQVYSTIALYRTELIVTEAALLVRQGRESELAAQWALDSAAHDVFEGRRSLDADRAGFEYLSGWFFSRMRRWMSEWGLDQAGQITCNTVGDQLSLSRDGFEAWSKRFKGLLLNELAQQIVYRNKVLPIGPDSVLYELLATFVRSPSLGLDKESIVLRCWKEHYNPLVHDARVYTAMRRIRSLTREELIVNSGRLYRLNPKVVWARASKSGSGNRAIERYQTVLDFVRINGSVTRQVIEQSLGLGSTQAKKEIQTMLDQGLLLRINKGPATRYRLRF